MPEITSPKLDLILASGIIVLLVLLIYSYRKQNLAEKDTSARLGVKELIEKVKSELVATEKKRIESNEAPLFLLKDFELEINFVVKEGTTQKGDVDFKVVTVGGTSDYTTEQTQKIKLVMTAVPPQPEKALPTDSTDKILTEPPPPEIKRGRSKTK
jgi:hypothetical protein